MYRKVKLGQLKYEFADKISHHTNMIFPSLHFCMLVISSLLTRSRRNVLKLCSINFPSNFANYFVFNQNHILIFFKLRFTEQPKQALDGQGCLSRTSILSFEENDFHKRSRSSNCCFLFTNKSGINIYESK